MCSKLFIFTIKNITLLNLKMFLTLDHMRRCRLELSENLLLNSLKMLPIVLNSSALVLSFDYHLISLFVSITKKSFRWEDGVWFQLSLLALPKLQPFFEIFLKAKFCDQLDISYFSATLTKCFQLLYSERYSEFVIIQIQIKKSTS